MSFQNSAVGYSGIGSFLFFIDETYFGGGGPLGTPASPAIPTTNELHIPVNPTEVVEWEAPQYEQYEVTLIGESLPTRVSTIVAPGTCTFTTIYHAPFLLARVFSTTSVGAWAADLTATIALNMNNYERTRNSICMHIHLDNRETSYSDIDTNLMGGKISSYKWEINSGEVLKEVVEMEFSKDVDGAIAMNTAVDYHNGRFAAWDSQKMTANNDIVALAQNKVTITTTTAIDNALSSIESASFEIKTPHQSHVGIGYESQNFDAKNSYDVEAIITGKIIDNAPIDEIRNRFESRSDADVKFLITNTGGYTEYLQCTKMKLAKIGTLSIPDAAGDAVLQLELTFHATSTSVLTYAGNFKQSATANPATYLV